MRSQVNSDASTSPGGILNKAVPGDTLADYKAQLDGLDRELQSSRRQYEEERKSIPSHEQDEDRWRYVSPGRDPVGEERGPGV
jgi:hypothetical protein